MEEMKLWTASSQNTSLRAYDRNGEENECFYLRSTKCTS
jgi:hypothetical protein